MTHATFEDLLKLVAKFNERAMTLLGVGGAIHVEAVAVEDGFAEFRLMLGSAELWGSFYTEDEQDIGDIEQVVTDELRTVREIITALLPPPEQEQYDYHDGPPADEGNN